MPVAVFARLVDAADATILVRSRPRHTLRYLSPSVKEIVDGSPAGDRDGFRVVPEFLAAVKADRYDSAALIAAEPDPLAAKWDALLGAVAEDVASRHDLWVPYWATKSGRFVAPWWFVRRTRRNRRTRLRRPAAPTRGGRVRGPRVIGEPVNDIGPLLTREDLVRLLDELAAELRQDGVNDVMFAVGGAAITLAYSTRRATRAIDSVVEPKAVVYAAARRIAARHDNLDDDWLNDAMKGYLPGDDPNATAIYEQPGLQVRVASPAYLLAMKVLAARMDRDADDIRLLADRCGLSTTEQVLDVVEKF